MSSSVPIPSLSTPSSAGGAVRRIDALFGVAWYDKRRAVPTVSVGVWEPESVNESDVMIVFGDRRVVRCSGWWVHSDVFGKILSFLAGTIEGVHVKTIPIISEKCVGLAVNTTETLMVVSSNIFTEDGSKVYLYSLPGGELLKSIAGTFNNAARPLNPFCLTFGPDDVIIVVDRSNDALLEFTSAGDYKRSVPCAAQMSLCVSNNERMVGVGSFKEIELLEYPALTSLRTVVGGSLLRSNAVSVQFTQDDLYILTTDYSLEDVKMFSVADGSFVRSICDGLGIGWKGLCVAPNGDIVIALEQRPCLRVYSPDGSVLEREFGSAGEEDGQFVSPMQLVAAGGRLYVLDYRSPRVQVFQ